MLFETSSIVSKKLKSDESLEIKQWFVCLILANSFQQMKRRDDTLEQFLEVDFAITLKLPHVLNTPCKGNVCFIHTENGANRDTVRA